MPLAADVDVQDLLIVVTLQPLPLLLMQLFNGRLDIILDRLLQDFLSLVQLRAFRDDQAVWLIFENLKAWANFFAQISGLLFDLTLLLDDWL